MTCQKLEEEVLISFLSPLPLHKCVLPPLQIVKLQGLGLSLTLLYHIGMIPPIDRKKHINRKLVVGGKLRSAKYLPKGKHKIRSK